MTIYVLHGIGAIFFWIIIACVFLYYKSEIAQDFFNDNDAVMGFIISVCTLCCLIFWIPSFMYYFGNRNENCGYVSEEACFEVIEKYNDKYNLSMTTEDEFRDFQKEQWNIGSNIRNIGLIVIVIVVISILIYEYLSTRMERELEKIDVSINSLKSLKNQTEEEKKLLFILKQSKEKILKQQRMAKVHSGIKALKKIEKTYNEIDIQSDIDELEALYKLNEIDYLAEKYK